MAQSAQATAALWTGRKTARVARIVLPSPAAWILAAFLVGNVAAVHAVPWLVFVVIPECLIVLGFWRMSFPDSYAIHVMGRARGTARSLLVYRWRWSRALQRSGVISKVGGTPLLVRTVSTPVYDRLKVRMVAGQRIDDFAEESDRLAQTFGALACRVHRIPSRPHWVELTFIIKDSLVKPVSPFPPEPDWLTEGFPVAIREDGKPWRLKLFGSHLLLIGATRAGKSSAIWALIDQLIPVIHGDKLAKLWVIDPKGGMELAAGQQHFARFAYGTRATEYAEVLEAAVRVMLDRQNRLRGITREHTPTTAEPWIIVLVDELAAVVAYQTDHAALRRIQAAIQLLLSQGAAVAVSVVGAGQDARKEILPFRGLFTIRGAFRLNEANEVAMVLGPRAWERGAKCDQIPRNLPGVLYVEIEGDPTPERVRFAHVSDSMIRDFKAPPPPTDPPPDPPKESEPAPVEFGVA